jgi:tRNA(Ile)-lysidine synthase
LDKSLANRKPKMTKFARALLVEWRRLELPPENRRVVVAVSGGADSSALLLALHELISANRLGLDLIVAHLDHGLRGKLSKEDATWVGKLAKDLGHPFVLGRANVRTQARSKADNLEQTARRARYRFLAKVAAAEGAQIIVTAHTMDDQAETVMLNLLRGSGAEGLAGIEPVRRLDERHKALLVRPLLRWARRADTEAYCAHHDLSPRIDEMNKDETYSRVRVRRQLLPLMETFNGRVVEALSRTASLLRSDSVALSAAADHLLQQATESAGVKEAATRQSKNKVPRLCVEVLATAAPALRLRALRNWLALGRGDLRRLELVHLLAVEKLLTPGRGGRIVELPGGARVVRERKLLRFLK